MAKKKEPQAPKRLDPHVQGLHAEVKEQPICQTLEQNYMPYAMSVIVSRAIPEIDGFKPSHRRTSGFLLAGSAAGPNPPTLSGRPCA